MASRHTRTDFTDQQKAEIYARDRATCCFSGKSLWLLDYQLTLLYDVDWVDHIVPSSKGGLSEISNGVCASSFFNSKKRDNSADNAYFFEAGKPTADYFYFFGPLPEHLVNQLGRLSRLDSSDWYFNRCLFSVTLGLLYIAEKKRRKLTRKRSDIYWFKAAWKRLLVYRRLSSLKGISSFETRNLILHPNDPATRALLSLRDAQTEEAFLKMAYSLYPTFYLNYDLAESFWEAETIQEMKAVLARSKREKCSSLLHETIRSHYLVEKAASEI